MATNENNRNYLGAFLVMVFLFFIIGFLTTANTQFQAPLRTAFLSGAGDAKNTLATLITFSWFLAYPVFGKAGARLVDGCGYKRTLMQGLAMMAAGMMLFFLSSWLAANRPLMSISLGGHSVHAGFMVFLLGSFVAGGAATILQVVVNPYLTACSVRGTQAVQRLAIGGTANSVGTTLAPYFVSGIAFGGMSAGQANAGSAAVPFLILAATLVAVMAAMGFAALPDIQGTRASRGEKLGRSAWSFRHLALGVAAIFCYVGCEVCIGGNLNLYVLGDKGGSVGAATLMATLYWGGLLAGRLLGSFARRTSPRAQLTFTSSAAALLVAAAIAFDEAWLLVAVGLFHSIMWGAVFTLATKGLGKHTSEASGAFMVGVVGGAILPLAQGFMADMAGCWRWSWSLVLAGELCILWYARIGSRPKETDLEQKTEQC